MPKNSTIPIPLVVCEKSSHWAAALRSAAGSSRLRIVETRSLAACNRELDRSPFSFAAIEITAANLEQALTFLVEAGARHSNARLVACLACDALTAVSLAREAGAIDVASSVLDVPRIVRAAARHAAISPQAPLSLEELIAERLPWSAYATT